MLRPAYRLTTGGKVVDTTGEPRASTAPDLSVALDMEMNDEPEQRVTQELAAEFESSRRIEAVSESQ